jgi:hypothetical protein
MLERRPKHEGEVVLTAEDSARIDDELAVHQERVRR